MTSRPVTRSRALTASTVQMDPSGSELAGAAMSSCVPLTADAAKLATDIASNAPAMEIARDTEDIIIDCKPCCAWIFWCCVRRRKLADLASTPGKMSLSTTASTVSMVSCPTCGRASEGSSSKASSGSGASNEELRPDAAASAPTSAKPLVAVPSGT